MRAAQKGQFDSDRAVGGQGHNQNVVTEEKLNGKITSTMKIGLIGGKFINNLWHKKFQGARTNVEISKKWKNGTKNEKDWINRGQVFNNLENKNLKVPREHQS